MAELNEIIHTSGRLRIMTTLAALSEGDRITFSRLRELLDMTAGNLSRHLTVLTDAHYVATQRDDHGRKPVTTIWATATGRAAYAEYLSDLQRLLTATGEQ